jgi:radical SAM protein with 4Fe4S-binding SPASM domain
MIPLRNTKRFFYKTLKQPLYGLNVFYRRLIASFYYAAGKGRSSFPEAVTLFLTHRCNLRCKMCGQWGEGGVTKKQGQEVLKEQLSLEESKKIIEGLAQFKPNITLFGGEPLLFRGCAELIGYIKRKGMHCLMITNGSLLENLAEAIVESGLDELNVSLDGGRQLHDEIRAMPGLFDRIMAGLERVNYFKAKKHKKKPLLNLQCTITKFNYKDLEQMAAVAKEARADSLTFHNLIFISQPIFDKQKEFDKMLNCSSLDWEGFVSQPGIDPKLLEEKKRQILSKKYAFIVDFYPNFSCSELAEYYDNPCYSPPVQNRRCLSPWLVAYIFPDGEVRPCLNLSYSFGNVKEESFLKIWNNAKARHFRTLLKNNKIFPACVRCTELYRY